MRGNCRRCKKMEVNDILKASWLNRKNFSKEYNRSEKCDLNIKKRKKNTKKKEFINLPLRHSVKNLPKNKQSL